MAKTNGTEKAASTRHRPLTDEERKTVEENLALIHWYIIHMGGKRWSRRCDLFSNLAIGLMNAVKAHKEAQVSLSTAATHQFRWALIRASTERKIISLPKHAFALARKARAMLAEETGPNQLNGWDPAETGASRKMALFCLEHPAMKPTESIEQLQENKDFDIEDKSEQQNLDNAMFQKEAAERIENALENLTYREREIIKLRFGSSKNDCTYTLGECGKIFSITKVRVQQVQKRAIDKLKHDATNNKNNLLELYETMVGTEQKQ